MTAHIEAKKEDIAKVVIMPGDPKRARFIAEKYLKNYRCINEVRGMLGFTGQFEGKEVTVMASGMGMPSIGIYAYELYKDYDVDTIIRVGSAGAFDPDLKVYDVILASEAYSDSSFALVQNGTKDTILKPSTILNDKIGKEAEKRDIPLHIGRIYSSDVFYGDLLDPKDLLEKKECIATEMESFALFHVAHILEKNAACLLTVSNHFITGEETTSEERERSFLSMIELALHSIKG